MTLRLPRQLADRVNTLANARASTVEDAATGMSRSAALRLILLEGCRVIDATTIKPRVSTLMTPWMNEGFFADVVVLVEGEDDRAAILGAAQAKGIHLESDGFAVIPCGGKASLDRPAAIFQGLGIAIYLLWDAD